MKANTSIPQLQIEVTRRSDDWIASLKDRPSTWECAATPESAIGKLIITLNGQIGIELEINLK